ncbi:MAG TPA: isoleucine--tRNA ligase [Flavobacteriales bacterium]|nr:isoleucine--tRNA ligase [Flavobacteriales bacterium]
MSNKYNEYKNLDLPKLADEILAKWDAEHTFEKSVSIREGKTPFVFFEGPPSANGMPGIHHAMARSIKDIFCRYKTLKGYQVKRKAGWDTHGLPIELGVEKELGITKEDIGKKISVDEYNAACRKAVMKYTDVWNDLTRKIGYWVDMDNPYVTYENKYIESVWWLLKNIYDKNLLYKGYSIQPYSPAAGTGLSANEINQPGCYRNVKDSSAIAMFKSVGHSFLEGGQPDVYFLAWTTTPWTLPSNTALAVGNNIDYVLVNTFNSYSGKNVWVILAQNLVSKYFDPKGLEADFSAYKSGDKLIPYRIANTFKGKDLVGIKYEQLLPYALPHENADKAFRVIAGDFVTTEDGTGIVHIAPTFGADDMKVAKDAGVPPMLVVDENGKAVPLVDLRGRFRHELDDKTFGLGGEYVKEAYLTDAEKAEELKKQKALLESAGIIKDLKAYLSVDDRIILKLQNENKLFKKEKYEHTYPHCWRTDKPVLYYPLDSWFIKITNVSQRMAELNNTINWKPESTGTGRFGNWLANANDWNLSRSRYWGVPLPIWRSETNEEIFIGSMEQLKAECEKSVKAGLMSKNPLENFVPGNFDEKNYNVFDLHRPYVDDIVLVSPSGKPMKRELDLIDVWFDSGSMPYAQWHYPFENKDKIDGRKEFPSDFIAEGVDQTRGWFYTLHAIATMCFDSVAYKNVVSNGLVLDKNGQKMSKRLGNAVDPFAVLPKYGPDAIRWYMISNAPPWDNLKFNEELVAETQRTFFRALYNTYAFFALYANIDGFNFEQAEIPVKDRPEIDRWILSKLNSLVKDVDAFYADYDPTNAARQIENFVIDNLSNWYVRLCRRRFWKGEYTHDKIAAYQTLYTCLETLSILAAPIAPFYAERLFTDLNTTTGRIKAGSVHLTDFPVASESIIDTDLEQRMQLAQRVSSMVLSLRRKENHRVRQPLQKIMIPVTSEIMERQLKAVSDLILSEVNIKQMELVSANNPLFNKTAKANFKTLGKKYGKLMKDLAETVKAFDNARIAEIESKGEITLTIQDTEVHLTLEDVEIATSDIQGWSVLAESGLTVALDINVSPELKQEGIARELVNRIQNLRKDSGLDVTDKIDIKLLKFAEINEAVTNNMNYICAEVLANSLILVDELGNNAHELDLEDGILTRISLQKA